MAEDWQSEAAVMLGQALCQARVRLGWGVSELAQRSGISAELVLRVEDGAVGVPRPHLLADMCPLLGIELPEVCRIRALADPQRLGKGLQTLRSRLDLSTPQAAYAAGISEGALVRLEAGTVGVEIGDTLAQLAAGLGLALTDLYWVVFESPPQRRFHAFNVGTGKSGTMSIARVFSRCSSGHEFLAEATLRHVIAHGAGAVDQEAMDGFLLTRDRLGNLELDSAGFHANYVDRLVELFPDAGFVVTLRDCYSWLDSFLNTVLNDVPGWPDWHFEAIYGRSFGLTRELISSPRSLAAELPSLLDALVDAWARPNRRVLAAVPENRRLVVRTHEIGSSLPELARFASVPLETLDLGASRANVRASSDRHHLLAELDERVVEECVARRCGDLMEAFFPEHSFVHFLDRGAMPCEASP